MCWSQRKNVFTIKHEQSYQQSSFFTDALIMKRKCTTKWFTVLEGKLTRIDMNTWVKYQCYSVKCHEKLTSELTIFHKIHHCYP